MTAKGLDRRGEHLRANLKRRRDLARARAARIAPGDPPTPADEAQAADGESAPPASADGWRSGPGTA